jgi:hypothetical protein
MQGLSIALLLMLLLLFPVFSGVVPSLLQSGAWYVRCFPPFWFLGIYERLMEGPGALPIYGQLARTGCMATLAAGAIVILSYPLAYLRRTRQVVEGIQLHPAGHWTRGIVSRVVNAVMVRRPERRAIFHYVSQTLFRVPRYRHGGHSAFFGCTGSLGGGGFGRWIARIDWNRCFLGGYRAAPGFFVAGQPAGQLDL